MVVTQHNISSGLRKPRRLIALTHIVYGLQALGLVFIIPWFVAIVANTIKRDDVADTWLVSHFDWQITTFWIALVFYCLGFATRGFGIGYPILIGINLWVVYRIVRGWLQLASDQPMQTDLESVPTEDEAL